MEPTTIVLFGATGDLAKRKIYPALYNLYLEQKLPETFSLIGLGRRDWSDEFFQAQVEKSLNEFSRRQADPEVVKSFVKAFRYSVLNISHKEDYIKLLGLVEQREAELGIPSNRLFYLSVGPEFFEPIAENIQESGLGSTEGWKRLVIEKPFGHDLQSARDLNRKLSESFTEEEIYRIDHYLGKPMVQRLETLHQSNPIMKALWNNRYISNVQITANETVGVEERASYYDHVGAVRDMFQNHMLQLLMMMAIQLPYNSTSEKVGLKKKHIMESIQPLQKQTVGANIIRGQYAEGNIQGKPVNAYTAEPGVAENTMNDTFIAAKLQIDDFFWRGVPFYIRTGKRMNEKSTRIVIEFKEPSGQTNVLKNKGSKPNLLVIEMSPDQSMTLQLNASDPENKGEFKPVHIDLSPDKGDLAEAYENLIRDALLGDPTFFAHWDEVELSWAWVQPILDAFQENLLPLHLYPAGSYGPVESDVMLEEEGHHWWFDEPADQESVVTNSIPLAVNANL
ncbi:glucose-6-phosphate dehydrogenase [Paenibacillus amylolyticus]|uniref:glucose-6-phosphate dehydrogenase n=1 Tax=Paenibacillus amylolyticus TaxID=1451 RepID=UPI00249C91C5|nr:glucose-6-phosphate dehydrogenase [Paenibacillus amylolyticus]WFA86408.1 glucose-6-phosphate dehydrogenase [Paenibacillus amylolyticus]